VFASRPPVGSRQIRNSLKALEKGSGLADAFPSVRANSAKELQMTKQFLMSMAALPTFGIAQPPPPPPAAAPVYAAQSTFSGRITQFNYGPEGQVEGIVVAPNNLIALPPDWAAQVEAVAKPGETARITGVVAPSASGMQIVRPQSIAVAGKVFTDVRPSAPAPYAGSGVVRQLNYGAQGEVNGFVLANGIIARRPPFGATDISVLKPGANIAISGFASPTPSGRTVVQVQSITVNGQTIAMNNMAPASGPDGEPGRGRRGRGPLGAAPPPPPPPELR
jgi:hypothetical protein